VKTSGILRHVLAIFVIAGLIAGPLAAPAAAADMAQATPMAGMSDDMPCCPHTPPPLDCPKCPFMAVCSVPQCLLGLPTGMVMGALTPTVAQLLIPLSDLQRDGLGYSPPPRPPRSLILSA
jgi:hypothetical protein